MLCSRCVTPSGPLHSSKQLGRSLPSYPRLEREANLGKDRSNGSTTWATDFHRKVISCRQRRGHKPTLTVGSISNAGF